MRKSLLFFFLPLLLACPAPAGQTPEPDVSDFDASDHDGDDVGDSDEWLEDWPGQEIEEEPLGIDWDMPAVDEGHSFLVANVGNIDGRCRTVDFNLCWGEQEEIIAREIARRSPDVILLQEVLVPSQCENVEDPFDGHVCHPDFQPEEPEQVRRLVGPDYTIACDAREGYECVATRIGRASIPGCDDGELCRDFARTGAEVEDCPPGFTVSAVTIDLDGRPLDVVNVHPPSDAVGITQGRRCRRAYFEDFFGPEAPLIENDDVLVGGDFNFDPFRGSPNHADVEIWDQYVSHSYEATHQDPLLFAYHSGLPEHDPPYYTMPIIDQTYDHVISNSLRGRCHTLGAHPGEPALDHFHGHITQRLDHLAIWCILAR